MYYGRCPQWITECMMCHNGYHFFTLQIYEYVKELKEEEVKKSKFCTSICINAPVASMARVCTVC